MASSHTEEMVYATSEDGLLLEGVAMRPAAGPPQSAAFIWIHGNAASFSAPAYVKIGRELAARGYLAIIGNTRGHDIACTLWLASNALHADRSGFCSLQWETVLPWRRKLLYPAQQHCLQLRTNLQPVPAPTMLSIAEPRNWARRTLKVR